MVVAEDMALYNELITKLFKKIIKKLAVTLASYPSSWWPPTKSLGMRLQ